MRKDDEGLRKIKVRRIKISGIMIGKIKQRRIDI